MNNNQRANYYYSLQGEIFKPIKGTNNKYYISNLGRVLSFCRNKPRILKPWINIPNGYYQVKIKGKNYFIHRLVAIYFIYNNNKEINNTVHHKDGNKYNNKASNLQWMSRKENSSIGNPIKEKKKI